MSEETAVFGAGCFWCTEAVFEMLRGVKSVEPGYTGGKTEWPSYEQVCGGGTGHIEVAKITYNPDELAFEELLGVFFSAHDATEAGRQAPSLNFDIAKRVQSGEKMDAGDGKNIGDETGVETSPEHHVKISAGQGNDIGEQYSSAIFYTTKQQKEKAEHYISVLNKTAGVKKIVTQVRPLEIFYPAEDYHKKYYESHKTAPYCRLIIDPKVEKVRKKFSSLIKSTL